METFILYTLKSSLCLAGGYLVYFLLLRKDTFHQTKRFILLGIIAASLVIPLIRINTHSALISLPVQKLESTILYEPQGSGETGPLSVTRPALPEHKPVPVLTLIYLAGAGIQILLLLIALTRIVLIFRNAEKIQYGNLKLAVTSAAMAPFCFGRHILISRMDFEENKDEILLHEKTHLEHRHNLDLLVLEIYLLLTWYNPFSWLIRHELKQNHEFEADRNVLQQGIDDSDYKLLLVRTIAGERLYHLANPFNQSNLKTRIAMMNRNRSHSAAILKALLFLPLIALMVQVFAQKVSQPGNSDYSTQAVNSSNSTKPAPKYLILKPEQLYLLGFEYSSNGIFYKTCRMDRPDKSVLCIYFTEDNYCTSIILKKNEKLKGNSNADNILKRMPVATTDYYPVIVAGYNNSRTLEIHVPSSQDPKGLLSADQKLLPIQVNVADFKLGKRSDTLLLWFKPTKSLKEVLASFANTDDYVQVCPPDPRNHTATRKEK